MSSSGLIALLILLPAVFGERSQGLARRVLSLRSLAWIGLVSYGFYLWHYYVMIALRSHHLNGLTQHYSAFFVLSFLGAITLAAGSYYLIERPALRFKQGRRFNRLALVGAAIGAFALLSTVAIAAHDSPPITTCRVAGAV